VIGDAAGRVFVLTRRAVDGGASAADPAERRSVAIAA